jgi:septum formation protein
MERIILASTSPRRKELLTQIGIPFTVVARPIDETASADRDPEELARELAHGKVCAVRQEFHSALPWILGADTLVYDRQGWLGKPETESEAREFMNRLAGRSHRVVTAVSLMSANGALETRHDTTTVRFATIQAEEMEWYLASNEWQGVAGGYRIQGRAACFVEELRGSYSTVMGLPIRTVYSMFKHNNYPFTSR